MGWAPANTLFQCTLESIVSSSRHFLVLQTSLLCIQVCVFLFFKLYFSFFACDEDTTGQGRGGQKPAPATQASCDVSGSSGGKRVGREVKEKKKCIFLGVGRKDSRKSRRGKLAAPRGENVGQKPPIPMQGFRGDWPDPASGTKLGRREESGKPNKGWRRNREWLVNKDIGRGPSSSLAFLSGAGKGRPCRFCPLFAEAEKTVASLHAEIGARRDHACTA